MIDWREERRSEVGKDREWRDRRNRKNQTERQMEPEMENKEDKHIELIEY